MNDCNLIFIDSLDVCEVLQYIFMICLTRFLLFLRPDGRRDLVVLLGLTGLEVVGLGQEGDVGVEGEVGLHGSSGLPSSPGLSASLPLSCASN